MIIYGHRGAKGEAPENTLAGFQHAYGHGIRHFELDLILSKDGVPMVLHDLTLERTTGKSGTAADYTAAELRVMDARRNNVYWPRPATIPSLADVLAACPDCESIQLEVKTDRRSRLNILCNRVTELIQRENLYDRTIVTSADTWFLQEIHRRDRRIRRGLVTERRFSKPVNTASRLQCEYLCLNWKISSAVLVEEAHRRGMHVSVWTVNRIQDMLDLERQGVDSIITDFPTSSRMFFDNRTHAPQLQLPHYENEQALDVTQVTPASGHE